MKSDNSDTSNIMKGLLFYLVVFAVFGGGFFLFVQAYETINSFVSQIPLIAFALYLVFVFFVSISLVLIGTNIYEKDESYFSGPSYYFGLSIWGQHDSNPTLKRGNIYKVLNVLNKILLIVFITTFVPLAYYFMYAKIYESFLK